MRDWWYGPHQQDAVERAYARPASARRTSTSPSSTTTSPSASFCGSSTPASASVGEGGQLRRGRSDPRLAGGCRSTLTAVICRPAIRRAGGHRSKACPADARRRAANARWRGREVCLVAGRGLVLNTASALVLTRTGLADDDRPRAAHREAAADDHRARTGRSGTVPRRGGELRYAAVRGLRAHPATRSRRCARCACPPSSTGPSSPVAERSSRRSSTTGHSTRHAARHPVQRRARRSWTRDRGCTATSSAPTRRRPRRRPPRGGVRAGRADEISVPRFRLVHAEGKAARLMDATTTHLVEFTLGWSFEDQTAAARTATLHRLVDTIAVAIAGTRAEPAKIAAQLAAEAAQPGRDAHRPRRRRRAGHGGVRQLRHGAHVRLERRHAGQGRRPSERHVAGLLAVGEIAHASGAICCRHRARLRAARRDGRDVEPEAFRPGPVHGRGGRARLRQAARPRRASSATWLRSPLTTALPLAVHRWGALSMMKGASTAFAVRNGVFCTLLARRGFTSRARRSKASSACGPRWASSSRRCR